MGLHERFTEKQAWNTGPGIADGADMERAVLGVPAIPAKGRKDEYMPFSDAVAYAKQHQPDVFSRSQIIKDLRGRIAELAVDITMPVKFFTAVGTPLDTYHGADAFFEQGERIVTLDVSLREKEHHKADVLLRVDFDTEGRPTTTKQEITRVAQEIAGRFNRDIRRKAA